nr:hypothetical protein CFP56_60294 [Quercus suber]
MNNKVFLLQDQIRGPWTSSDSLWSKITCSALRCRLFLFWFTDTCSSLSQISDHEDTMTPLRVAICLDKVSSGLVSQGPARKAMASNDAVIRGCIRLAQLRACVVRTKRASFFGSYNERADSPLYLFILHHGKLPSSTLPRKSCALSQHHSPPQEVLVESCSYRLVAPMLTDAAIAGFIMKD